MGTGIPDRTGAASGLGADAGQQAGTKTASAPWQGPTDVEQALYEAKMRDDWTAYFDVLGNTWLYSATPRDPMDELGERTYSPYWNEQTDTHCVPLFTIGALPAPVADPVYFSENLTTHAEDWPDDTWWLAVNPGTPCEAYFPATAAHRGVWHEHFERTWQNKRGTLLSFRADAPLHGPVAHGLACSALMFVTNGQHWNSLAHHGHGYNDERHLLEEWWGVTERTTWQTCLEQLLRGEMVDPRWEFVLTVRDNLRRDRAHTTGAVPWREATETLVRERMAELAAASDGPLGPDLDARIDAEVEELQGLIGCIMRYESRLRADGLLGENGYVRSALAWDSGRASSMARWGQSARFCELSETEDAVLRAGRVSQATYDSWEEFSVGYILGRCLHFDEEEFGTWYDEMLSAHRILMTDPASPWLSIPFK